MTMDVLIRDFPQQLLDALEQGKTIQYKKPEQAIHNIVVIGMGGSGIGADFVEEFTRAERSVPFLVCKSYELPAFVNQHSLVICSSYSGNTEETLSGMEEAVRRGATIVCLASGGKVIDRAKELGCDYVQLPNFGAPPRACMGYSIVHQLYLLHQMGFSSQARLDEIASAAQLLSEQQENLKTRAQYIAKYFVGKFPILYTTDRMSSVAVRWRQQLNENSKILCGHHIIPEMNHNELVGWREQPTKFAVVLLRSHNDHPRNQVRAVINREIIGHFTDTVIEVFSSGNSLVEEMFYLVHLGDWVSWEVAQLRGVDAVEVRVIDYLKGELSQR